MASNEAVVRRFFAAFSSGDREAVDAILADDLHFSAPPDPHLDKTGWFERCWANRHMVAPQQEIDLVLGDGGDVVVRYLATRENGEQFRNLEYFHVAGGRVDTVQVYFGATV